MDLFTKKGFIQKLIVAIIIVILCNFTIPNYSNASFFESAAVTTGGVLFEGVQDLVVFTGDTILGLLQHNFYSTSELFITANSSEERDLNAGTIVVRSIGSCSFGNCYCIGIWCSSSTVRQL